MVLILVLLDPGMLGRLFSATWIVWLGLVSYSLYLWQGVGLADGGLAGALGGAVASYYVVERRFSRRRSVPRERLAATPSPDVVQSAT